jgi:type II secretory pathway component GspD/PulD (secretin)
MSNLIKITSPLLVASLLLFSLSTQSLAEEGSMNLRFSGNTLTAKIEDIPLKAVLEEIEDKKGIWFHVSSQGSLEDEKISVEFKDLSIRAGLERILSSMNYSLFFDQSSVVGVMLFGKTDGTRSGTRTAPKRSPRKPSRRR